MLYLAIASVTYDNLTEIYIARKKCNGAEKDKQPDRL